MSRPLRLFVTVAASVAFGCAGLGVIPGEGLRLSDQVDAGDARFRASMGLVLEGLEADAGYEPDRAAGRYQHAITLDATNPYAYLAIARHRVDGTDPASALPFLEKARALLQLQDRLTPGAVAHLDGLRGAALLAQGRRDEALPLLERARSLAPRAWSDARLEADELR